MKRKLSAACLFGLAMLFGCATTNINNPISYPKVPMVKADIMPTPDDITRGKSRVVIFPPDNGNSEIARNANVGLSITAAIENYLSKTGAEIVDRNLAKELKEEIGLAEMKGKSEYKGAEIADFAITGQISEANFETKFTEKSTYVDTKGRRQTAPAHCTYRANVNANLRIYQLPSLKFSQTVNINDGARHIEEVAGRVRSRDGNSCPYTKTTIESLMREAASRAVKSARSDLQTYFATKSYVLECRRYDKKYIFKLSRGKNHGIKQGSKITFYHLDKSTDPLTNATRIEEYSIAEGLVSDQVGENHAWVIVDDLEKAKNIKLGDYVKVSYQRDSLGEEIFNAIIGKEQQ